MSEEPTKLRWGILGAANIARKNWKAIRNSGNSTVVAVASRDLKRSRAFIDQCQAEAPMETTPKALASYEELVAARDVDAVYIPLPTGIRKEWVIRCAEAGKHIVCEKPCAASVADLREMLAVCRDRKVQFMDGVMFMHSRRLERLRRVLEDQSSVGRIKRITSAFSFLAEDDFFSQNIRGNSALEPHGCLGDLGWYCIRLALTLMGEELPGRVIGRILSETSGRNSPAPVPTEFSGELLFNNGVSSGFYCSFLSANEQWAQVTGDRGCVHMSDFVLPFLGNEVAFETISAEFNVSGCDFNMEARRERFAVPEHSNSYPDSQETNLFRNFAAQVLSGALNEAWPDMALKTQVVMNACLQSARGESGAENLRSGAEH